MSSFKLKSQHKHINERRLKTLKSMDSTISKQIDNEEQSSSGHSSCEDDAEMDKCEGDAELTSNDHGSNVEKPNYAHNTDASKSHTLAKDLNSTQLSNKLNNEEPETNQKELESKHFDDKNEN